MGTQALSTALVLHPDPLVQDPYGLLTRRQFYDYMSWADGYVTGWNEARETMGRGPVKPNPCSYADARDALYGLCDMPPHWAQAMALHLTRDSTMYYLSFQAIL
jgi:hypothetical protein